MRGSRAPFKLRSEFQPKGDQPKAIEELCAGLDADRRYQTLLGITGSGKTFTIANVIQHYGRPTLIIAPNKTLAAGEPITVVFTPQLAPMSRGILSVAYARLLPGKTADDCRNAARALYAQGLVSVLDDGILPDTLWVRGSARAHVAYALDARTSTIIAMAAIDNLAKGASAQAVQAFNVSMGWPDALGLPEIAQFP